jgi:hypothetical protein
MSTLKENMAEANLEAIPFGGYPSAAGTFKVLNLKLVPDLAGSWLSELGLPRMKLVPWVEYWEIRTASL